MSKILLNDLRVYLDYLLRGPRRAELDAVAPVTAGYTIILNGTLSAIEALPPALLGGAPNAQSLEETDIRHDGLGNTLFYLAKAVLAYPDATAEQKESAKAILEKVVASRRELTASYATEASRASERRPGVDAARSVLERITLFATNAYAIATSFLDTGATLATLLSGRAEAIPDRSPAGALRAKAIGQIATLRDLLADATESTPAEARRLDARFFAFYDLLTHMRETGSKDPTPTPPPDPTPAG